MTSASLRLRLFVIILVPLLSIAAAVGAWRVREAQQTARDLFDRNLLFTAVAVSRDVALADGDAISQETRDLLGRTAGGPVFYHVYAPDGAFVTGYATPPVPLSTGLRSDEAFAYYDASYQGRPVRVLRLRDVTQIGGLSGTFTITVWQDQEVRQEFVRALIYRAFAVMAALVGTVALVVWFGVNLGLKPLLDLEEAISRRSPDDLSPIQRRVPQEARGIVQRLNGLLGQVSSAMEAQVNFISNAAHQLRNPIAGVLALGESVQSARTLGDARKRAGDLVAAAGQASDLANKLLTLERVRSSPGAGLAEPVDLAALVGAVAEDFRPAAREVGVEIRAHLPLSPVAAVADKVMLREALANLIDNALLHGGPGVSRVTISLGAEGGRAEIRVADDGRGIDPADAQKILARFGQGASGQGSGLGLSIAEAVAERHGGKLEILRPEAGFLVRLSLPLADAPAPSARDEAVIAPPGR